MMTKIAKLPQIADPTIVQAFEEFLAEQRERLKQKTYKKYEEVIELLQGHLNNYAHEGLSAEESAFFNQHYNAEGKDHREFCQLFGPEKIIDDLSSFLGFFMIRKVLAGEDFKRAAGTVTKKLSSWLLEKGYISEESAQKGEEEGAEAARDLPRAERAAQIIFQTADALVIDFENFADEDYLDFDYYTITKVESGKLWLKVYEEGGEETVGPIPVSKKATELLQEGWEISCALGRIHGKWRIVEIANVYPA